MKKNHILPFLWMRGESEEILREEMEKIDECGIGAVCVEARPHEEFCKAGWWHDMDIIIDEAKKRDMKIWILDDKHFPTGYANGLIEEKYPERKKLYITVSKANVAGYPNRQMTLNIKRMLKPAIGFWEIGDALKNAKERDNNELFAVIAVRKAEGKELQEETINLTDSVKGDFANFTLPAGMWTVYVIFKTRTDGGNEAYINLLDEVSARTQIEGVYETHYKQYKEEFGKTIAGFFSDETQFGNITEVCYDAALGKKKMPLPWSDEMEAMLTTRHGESYVELLPFLFDESQEKKIQLQIRYDYMDCASLLYQKNFSKPIGQWCEDHGVEYIGHIVEDNGCHSRLGMGPAHFFRAMSGQHMAGIDCIGEQIVLGAPAMDRLGLGEIGGDGEFYHYTLGKLGASSGHLDPVKKGRTMCELFGAYGWNFGVRDMKYVLDHLLVRGVNELVPHAFSMADYPDIDCPPHFYARGNNPQFPYFAELMKYANRMCDLLSDGQHVASVAVLYDGEADWIGGGMPMQKVCRELMEHQIDFDIVSIDMLDELSSYNGALKGDTLEINGVSFEALIVPYSRAVPKQFAEFIQRKEAFTVIFADDYPTAVLNDEASDIMTTIKNVCEVIKVNELADMLRSRGMYQIESDSHFKDLSFYHYSKEREIFVFQNESPTDTYNGTITLPTTEDVVYYNGFDDTYESAIFSRKGQTTEVSLSLAPTECVVLLEKKGIVYSKEHRSYSQQTQGLKPLDISADWEVRMTRAIDYPEFGDVIAMKTLVPISEQFPEFAGVIRYSKTINLDKVADKAYIKAEQVYEVMKVIVNGKETGMCLTPPYQLELKDCLQLGDNEIIIEVATTPSRDQLTRSQAPFDFIYEAMEATGMCGKVELLY